jgi:hypothetical protein
MHMDILTLMAFIFGVMGWAFSTHANFRITNLTREFESLTRKV